MSDYEGSEAVYQAKARAYGQAKARREAKGDRLGWKRTAAIAGLAVASFLAGSQLALNDAQSHFRGLTVPKCEEDEIVMGTGDFSGGLWDRYRCEHPDNLVTETTNPKLALGTRLQNTAGNRYEVVQDPTSGWYSVELVK